jgi:hypothetical protein
MRLNDSGPYIIGQNLNELFRQLKDPKHDAIGFYSDSGIPIATGL